MKKIPHWVSFPKKTSPIGCRFTRKIPSLGDEKFLLGHNPVTENSSAPPGMSAQPILGHFLAHFYGFSSKLPEIPKFSLKIIILNTSLPFWCKILSEEETFNFRPTLSNFHEYTLNMTSYHVTRAINGLF